MKNKEILENLKDLVESWSQNVEVIKTNENNLNVVRASDVHQFLLDINYYLDMGLFKPVTVPVVVNYIVATQEQWHYLNTEEKAVALQEELAQLNIQSIIMKDVKVFPESDNVEFEERS